MKMKNKSEKEFAEQCQWPVMGDHGFHKCECMVATKVPLPLLSKDDGGLVRAQNDKAVLVPFCRYHSFLAMNGQFGVTVMDGMAHLHGPLKDVELIESVVEAYIVAGRFEESKRAVARADMRARKTAKEMKGSKDVKDKK